jgi:hypothetical protein
MLLGSLKARTNCSSTETRPKLPSKRYPRRFWIIHLAVQGVANAEFPDRAALVLGRSSASVGFGSIATI